METTKRIRYRRQPLSRLGMTMSRYDMNMTGYTLLSVTPLSHDQKPSCSGRHEPPLSGDAKEKEPTHSHFGFALIVEV